MKTIALILLVASFSLNTYGQVATGQAFTENDYLKKSKNQKMAAWILLGAGVAATVGGIISVSSEFDLYSNAGEGGAIIAGIGIASMVGSIPLFVASGINKKKASQVSAGFTFERLLVFNQKEFYNQRMPALTVSVSF